MLTSPGPPSSTRFPFGESGLPRRTTRWGCCLQSEMAARHPTPILGLDKPKFGKDRIRHTQGLRTHFKGNLLGYESILPSEWTRHHYAQATVTLKQRQGRRNALRCLLKLTLEMEVARALLPPTGSPKTAFSASLLPSISLLISSTSQEATGAV